MSGGVEREGPTNRFKEDLPFGKALKIVTGRDLISFGLSLKKDENGKSHREMVVVAGKRKPVSSKKINENPHNVKDARPHDGGSLGTFKIRSSPLLERVVIGGAIIYVREIGVGQEVVVRLSGETFNPIESKEFMDLPEGGSLTDMKDQLEAMQRELSAPTQPQS